MFENGKLIGVDNEPRTYDGTFEAGGKTFAPLESDGVKHWFLLAGQNNLIETLSLTIAPDGTKLYH